MKIPKNIFFIVLLACGAVDFLLLVYWCGIYHVYDPTKHAQVAEFSFGNEAMSRYWQLIMTNFFCCIVYTGTGFAWLFYQKSQAKGCSKSKIAQKITIGLCIFSIIVRVLWCYTEARQFLVSVRTLVRREHEIYAYKEALASIGLKPDDLKKDSTENPNAVQPAYFHASCLIDAVRKEYTDAVVRQAEAEARDRASNGLLIQPKSGSGNFQQDELLLSNETESQNPFQPFASKIANLILESRAQPWNKYGSGNGGTELKEDSAVQMQAKLETQTPTFCIYENELLYVDTFTILVFLIFQILGVSSIFMFLGSLNIWGGSSESAGAGKSQPPTEESIERKVSIVKPA